MRFSRPRGVRGDDVHARGSVRRAVAIDAKRRDSWRYSREQVNANANRTHEKISALLLLNDRSALVGIAPQAPRTMTWLRAAFRSTVGMKWLMGITGLVLSGFVVVHMLGNLQIYLGPDAINGYAEALRHQPALLWIARLVLLTAFALHITAAVRITQLNRAARPHGYELWSPQVTSYAARTMFMGGVILFTFVLYHLAHFTFGVTHPEHFRLHDAQGRHDVYGMVVLGFRQPLVSFFYLLAMIPLMLHLQHGVSSFLQTFGLNHPRYNRVIRLLGPVVGLIVFLGNCSIPLAVLAGWIPYPVVGR